MRTTNDISVILNERAIEIILSMKINYSSSTWKVKLLEAVNNSIPEINLIDCFDHVKDPDCREIEITSFMKALSFHKLPYVAEYTVIEYRNVEQSLMDSIKPIKKLKFN